MKRLGTLAVVLTVASSAVGCNCWPFRRNEQPCGAPPVAYPAPATCAPQGVPAAVYSPYTPPAGYNTAPMVLPGPTTYAPQ